MTDAANIDNELILSVWCDRDGMDERIHTRMEYFTVVRPQSVTAKGLFSVLDAGLKALGITEISTEKCAKLVGIGTDGASANIAVSGLKGLVEERLDCFFWMWCPPHRLELKPTAFGLVDELLLYYLHKKSPKRCRELEDIITDLKGWFSFDDVGVRPVRASGSRWVSHKPNAMKRVLSKCSAYTAHLVALAEDRSLKGTTISGLTLSRVKRGKTERGVKRNTCIQLTITKQGINRTTLYHRTLRYDLQRIHACKMFGLTAHHHRNTAQ